MLYTNTEFVIMSNVYLTVASVSAVSLCSDMSGVGGSEMLMSSLQMKLLVCCLNRLLLR